MSASPYTHVYKLNDALKPGRNASKDVQGPRRRTVAQDEVYYLRKNHDMASSNKNHFRTQSQEVLKTMIKGSYSSRNVQVI